MLKKEVCRLVTPGIINEYLRILIFNFNSTASNGTFPSIKIMWRLICADTKSRFFTLRSSTHGRRKVSSELLNQLFEMNYRIAMAKFAMADDGMVRLVCDFPL